MVRKKNRYILAEVIIEDFSRKVEVINEASMYQEIRDAFQRAFGDFGMGLVKKSLSVRYFIEETNMLLVRIRRGAESMLSNVFLTMKSICNIPVKIITKHTSGSIRCAQKYWVRYSRRKLTSTLSSITDFNERNTLQQKINDINKTDFSYLFGKRDNKSEGNISQSNGKSQTNS